MQNHAQNKPPIRNSQKGHCHQGLEFKSPIKICCLHFCFWNLTLSYIMVDPTPTKANMLHYTEHEWTVPLSCSLLKASVNNETFHSTMHCLVPKKRIKKSRLQVLGQCSNKGTNRPMFAVRFYDLMCALCFWIGNSLYHSFTGLHTLQFWQHLRLLLSQFLCYMLKTGISRCSV